MLIICELQTRLYNRFFSSLLEMHPAFLVEGSLHGLDIMRLSEYACIKGVDKITPICPEVNDPLLFQARGNHENLAQEFKLIGSHTKFDVRAFSGGGGGACFCPSVCLQK